MRIAFDLDDTLIPGEHKFPLEPAPRGLLAGLFCREPLRLGTVDLFTELRRQGHEIWIYTTSFRRPLAMKALFWYYGTSVGKVINEHMHQKLVASLGPAYKLCTKYPPAFGIDVLVDNSHLVLLESKTYDYDVLHVLPDDDDWVGTILDGLGID